MLKGVLNKRMKLLRELKIVLTITDKTKMNNLKNLTRSKILKPRKE